MSDPKRCPAGEALVDWLERNGRTQTWLAEELGIAHAVLWRWIAGERSPRIESCAAIERLTGIPSRAWAQVEKGAA